MISLVDDFLNSHQLSSWQYIDLIKRIEILMTFTTENIS